MKRLLLNAVIYATSGALVLFSGACSKKKEGPGQRPPVIVQTAVAKAMDVPLVISAYGNTEDKANADIVPQVSGTLVETLIRDGAAVTNGQPLFRIDSRDYAIRVAQAEGMIAADKSAVDLARSIVDRNKSLLAEKLISAQDFDILKTKMEAAQAQLQIDQAVLEQARLNLSRCTVTAPFAGVCSKRYLNAGNLVTAGLTKLTNIRCYDPITIEFSVSEEHLVTLRQAMAKGEVQLEIVPQGDTATYHGIVTFIDNAVNVLAGAILMRGEVPNPDLKLWARQFVEVRVIAGQAREAIMVPEGAVQFGKNGPYLYAVTKDNQAQLRPVKTGVRFNNMIRITEGLAPDETVVVLGQLMLYPGATVMDASQLPPAKH